MNGVHMRIRSEYSSRLAYGKLQDVHNRVLELNWPAAPLTDRMSTFGFVFWNELCQEVKVKPIFGVELGVSAQLGQKRPAISYWTFIAIKELRSINELVFKATSKVGQYHSLTYEEAVDAPDTVKVADHRVFLSDIHNISEVKIALSPSISIGLFRLAKEKGFQFVASPDNVFPYVEDKLTYHTLFFRDAETALYPQYILTDDEWRASLPYCVTDEDAEQAIANRNSVMEMCSAELLKATTFKPSDIYSLKQMCIEGACKLGVDLNNPIYAERLERELKLIYEKGFNDYFYIVSDLVNFAKQHMIVGPARGSAAGSLVSYLTGITTVDPIKFNLLFERFIDVSRSDLPDIDLDFSDTKRHLVFDYLKCKYGAEHVAHLGTTLKFKAKSIMNRAGMSLGIPKWLSDKVSETLIERSSADSRAMQTFEETFSATDVGKQLLGEFPEISVVFDVENHVSHYGTHAAGVAITSDDVLKYVAIDGRNGTIMADKYDAERLNILKIDILGVSQLSIFERCLELIGKPAKNGFLETLPLNDQAAFDVLNKKHFSGIFQANGKSLQILFQMIHTSRIEDLVAITALSRPGPVGTGGAVRWARRRSGTEAITYRHPMLEPYLKDTYGEVVYQEQVMQICRDIGRMGFADISKVRKAMSKSMGAEEIKSYGTTFIAGALETGIPVEIVDTIWGELVRFGAYGFNLSHAVSYGLITYYCCWLKAHYPVEFAAATLDSEFDPMKQLFLLRELDSEGIKYQPIDPKLSTDKWAIKETDSGKILVGPLTNIKGIGPVTVRKILESRLPGGKPLSPGIVEKLTNAATKIDSLTPISNAIRKLHPDLKVLNIYTKPTLIKDIEPGIAGEVVVLALVKRIQPRDLNDLQSVNKRGYKINGQSMVLRIFVYDDTDEILCQIDRFDYLTLGKEIEEKAGQAGDLLYAIKGIVPETFRMIKVSRIKYLGNLSDVDKPVIKNDMFAPKQKDLFA
jgi:DNA-directed DNA polymerase III PolC